MRAGSLRLAGVRRRFRRPCLDGSTRRVAHPLRAIITLWCPPPRRIRSARALVLRAPQELRLTRRRRYRCRGKRRSPRSRARLPHTRTAGLPSAVRLRISAGKPWRRHGTDDRCRIAPGIDDGQAVEGSRDKANLLQTRGDLRRWLRRCPLARHARTATCHRTSRGSKTLLPLRHRGTDLQERKHADRRERKERGKHEQCEQALRDAQGRR